MAARPVTHPSADALQAYGLGKLDDPTAQAVQAHLESCPDCRAAVAAVSGDSFLGRLRAAREGGNTQAPGKSLSGVARSLQPTGPIPAADLKMPPELLNHPQYEVVRELGR